MNIALQRLTNQHLVGAKLQKPDEVVAWLGAVQAQEYALAKWGLGLRMEQATDDVIEQAVTDGTILRTHVMRPTWHFVTAADIRWILELTAPRVHMVNGHRYRDLELDEGLLRRSKDIIANALSGGKHLTRAELGAVLTENGVDSAHGSRLGYIVHYAELEGVVCSGPRRGKQHTYGLVDERAPHAVRMAREEALATLTKRFFTSHGPATVKDFSWWSGLTMADGKAGLAMLGDQIISDVIDGETYWFAASMPTAQESPTTGFLLPVYDEFTIAYKNHSALLDPSYGARIVEERSFISTLVFKEAIIGMWKRTISKQAVTVELRPFRPITASEQEAFVAAAQRFGAFLNMPVMSEVGDLF